MPRRCRGSVAKTCRYYGVSRSHSVCDWRQLMQRLVGRCGTGGWRSNWWKNLLRKDEMFQMATTGAIMPKPTELIDELIVEGRNHPRLGNSRWRIGGQTEAMRWEW